MDETQEEYQARVESDERLEEYLENRTRAEVLRDRFDRLVRALDRYTPEEREIALAPVRKYDQDRERQWEQGYEEYANEILKKTYGDRFVAVEIDWSYNGSDQGFVTNVYIRKDENVDHMTDFKALFELEDHEGEYILFSTSLSYVDNEENDNN